MLVGHRLAGRDRDEIAAVSLEPARKLHGLLRRHAAVGPVGGRDLHRDRPGGGPHGAHGVEDGQRVAQAIVERPAVRVGARVGQRRDERRQQVAVGHVQLEHVEARGLRHRRRLDEVSLHALHVGAVHRLRDLAVREVRDRRRRDQRPVPLGQRLVDTFPQPARGALAPGVGELKRDPRRRMRVNEIHDALPRRHVLGLVHPRAARADPALAAHVGHLGDDEPRAADRATAEIHQVPVVRRAVIGRVLAHRRDDDPVGQDELAQPERYEHGRRHRLGGNGHLALVGGLRREPAVHRLDELGVADLEVVVRDAQAAGEQAEGELERLEPSVVALGLLEPLEAHLGRPLDRLHLGPPLLLVGVERAGDVAVTVERRGQRDGVLHRELGPGADREVRGVGGVTDEHDVVPVPVRVLDRREAAPQRAVLQEPMAFELAREEPLGEDDGVVLAHLVEAGAPPRRLRRLHDERRVSGVVAVGVDAPEAVRALLEDEGEGAERKRRAEPHEPVRAPVHVRLEVLGVLGADQAVDAVGGQHQIGVAIRREIGDVGLEPQGHAQLGAASLEDVEQGLARHPREPVAGGGQNLALIVDVDVVPVREGAGDRLAGGPVGLDEGVERGVGEDHPEAEGVVGPVALDDGDVVAGIGLLHQQGEVEPGRTAADRDDPPASIVPKARGDRRSMPPWRPDAGDAWAADAV